ncbi:hypothetical protein ACQ9BO_12185 [Flavobacterium sp. P21]|uniref:hypothetical protein n=1 Tax=Flavobacterium sp. P21 TaxID=3423948 RepID=UPI003D6757B5
MIKVLEKDWEILHQNFRIRREELFPIFPYRANFEELKQLLLESKTDSVFNNRFNAILWRFPISMSDNEFMKLLQFFLLENWHHDHEFIISSFQDTFYDDKENIKILMQAFSSLPEFYKYDEAIKYPYIRKIIYAIGAQPEPYNIEALETISQSEDEEIKALALHQIEKRKRLGRWEAENDQ